jgi:hypothetical protein
MSKLARYWKAIAAFVAPGCALLIVDSNDGWSSTELSVAALTCVVSAAAVWAAPRNKQDA